MSTLAKNSQESVTRYDPFVAFDALDDEQIIAELKGQVLAELDKEDLEARFREAKAALLGAESNLKAAQAQLEKRVVE